jgi:hypothetical protein
VGSQKGSSRRWSSRYVSQVDLTVSSRNLIPKSTLWVSVAKREGDPLKIASVACPAVILLAIAVCKRLRVLRARGA